MASQPRVVFSSSSSLGSVDYLYHQPRLTSLYPSFAVSRVNLCRWLFVMHYNADFTAVAGDDDDDDDDDDDSDDDFSVPMVGASQEQVRSTTT